MRRLAIMAFALLALAQTRGAMAGIDQVFTKPEDKPSWGEIFKWALGSEGFDKSYALVIGISDYPGEFASLRSTKNDPIRMKNFLLEEAGFDYVHVLTDEKAQTDRIKQLMEGKFRRLVSRDDRFLFYWSGHGTQVKDALGRTVGYLPLGNSKRDETWTMISMDDVSNWDRWIKAEHALFLLDACFSGLAGSEAKNTLQDFTIQRLSKPAHHLISAGTGDQQTIASERWNGSIFTDSIIRAARGEADAQNAFPRDGVVNLAELLAFVRQRIDHERRDAKWDKAITPQWNHLRSNEGEFFFVTKAKKVEVAKRQGTPTGALESGMPIVEPLGPSEVAPQACDSSADRLYWESIKDETDPAYFTAYLAKVANGELCGLFEEIARIKVKNDLSGGIAVVQPPPRPAPIHDIMDEDKQMEAVTASNVRLGPSVDTPRIGRLSAGTIVDVTGHTTISGSKWYRVAMAGGSTGFVSGRLLNDLSKPSVTPVVGVFEKQFKSGDIFRDCSNCPEMVVVPAGSFMMGSPGSDRLREDTEGPQHRVTISQPITIGKYEVTFDEWDACVDEGGCNGYRPTTSPLGRGRHPVYKVNWDDAQAYVRWLSEKTGKVYRLLSEAEWEYAARAGSPKRYWWGDDIGTNNANCHNCGSQWDQLNTATVGSFRPNGFGLYDTAGNVREWVEDCWNSSYQGAPTDGSAWTTGDCKGRIRRGGSFGNLYRDIRSAFRDRTDRGNRYYNNGFRVARTLP